MISSIVLSFMSTLSSHFPCCVFAKKSSSLAKNPALWPFYAKCFLQIQPDRRQQVHLDFEEAQTNLFAIRAILPHFNQWYAQCFRNDHWSISEWAPVESYLKLQMTKDRMVDDKGNKECSSSLLSSCLHNMLFFVLFTTVSIILFCT